MDFKKWWEENNFYLNEFGYRVSETIAKKIWDAALCEHIFSLGKNIVICNKCGKKFLCI